MRVSNIQFFCFVYDKREPYKILKSRAFVSEQAKNKWCNSQYKNNDYIIVEVYNGLTDRLIETWSA